MFGEGVCDVPRGGVGGWGMIRPGRVWSRLGGWGGGDLRDGDGVGDVQQDDTSCDHAIEGGVAAEV